MRRQPVSSTAIFLLMIAVSACSKSGGTQNSNGAVISAAGSSSTKFVKANVIGAEMPVGDSAEAAVTIAIQQGYHINANPPTFPYLKATEVSVENGDAVLVSFITYPNALTRKFSFADQPLAVYEGEVAIKLTLKAAKGAAKKSYSLPAKLKLQACDDQVCYAPGAIDLSIPVTIK